MKKILITLVMIASLTKGVMASEEGVNSEVLNAFKNDFANAKNVSWQTAGNYYKASFTINGNILFAFYNENGEFLGVARNILSTELPDKLKNSWKKNYNGYWITDLFRVTNHSGTFYYITLQNADEKVILEAKNNKNWTLYQ
jgi:hypothetical protein